MQELLVQGADRTIEDHYSSISWLDMVDRIPLEYAKENGHRALYFVSNVDETAKKSRQEYIKKISSPKDDGVLTPSGQQEDIEPK